MRNLIHTLKIAEIKYGGEKLKELKSKTNKDITLKRVEEYYMNGWPNKLKEANEINHFYKIKSELVIEDELVYYENMVVIKKKLSSRGKNKSVS